MLCAPVASLPTGPVPTAADAVAPGTLPPTVALAYILAAILFIMAATGLSKHETAVAGNIAGACGMVVAVAAAVGLALTSDPGRGVLTTAILIILALSIGAVVGMVFASRVAMTGMPQLIAVFNGLVGLAAVVVGYNSYIAPDGVPGRLPLR